MSSGTALYLSLSVCLGVEGSGEGILNAKECAKLYVHITSKAHVSVCNM